MPPSEPGGTNSRSGPSSEIDDPLFFYMPDTKWGEFCQWYPSTFTVSKGAIARLVNASVPDGEADEAITFKCAEQFMMYCKAARFHDHPRLERILESPSPKEQKALGRATVGFSHESWDQVKSEVVKAGNIAKFGQNPHLKNVLLGTGDRLLVEAASKDRVWGIGYTEKHALNHRKHWGENRLGQALMAVRSHLRQQELLEREPWRAWEQYD